MYQLPSSALAHSIAKTSPDQINTLQDCELFYESLEQSLAEVLKKKYNRSIVSWVTYGLAVPASVYYMHADFLGPMVDYWVALGLQGSMGLIAYFETFEHLNPEETWSTFVRENLYELRSYDATPELKAIATIKVCLNVFRMQIMRDLAFFADGDVAHAKEQKRFEDIPVIEEFYDTLWEEVTKTSSLLQYVCSKAAVGVRLPEKNIDLLVLPRMLEVYDEHYLDIARGTWLAKHFPHRDFSHIKSLRIIQRIADILRVS